MHPDCAGAAHSHHLPSGSQESPGETQDPREPAGDAGGGQTLDWEGTEPREENLVGEQYRFDFNALRGNYLVGISSARTSIVPLDTRA